MTLLGIADKREPFFDMTLVDFFIAAIVLVVILAIAFWLWGKVKSL
jgi:hypothetical protein